MGATAVAVRPATEQKVSRQNRKTARNLFRTLHLVIGLSFGLILVSQGLSGATLVWRPELDRLMLPGLTHGGQPDVSHTPSLDSELGAVKAAAPQAKVRSLRLPLHADGSDEWMVQLPATDTATEGPRWTVYTSPVTGQVLGIRGAKRDALQFLIELHHNLLWGRTGRSIQGYLALATLLLALSGLWLWWPAQWMPSRFRPRAAARPLHYAVGFWAMWPLLLIAATATYLVWRQPMQQAFGVADKQSGAQAQRSGEGEHRHQDHQDHQGDEAHGKNASASVDAVIAAAHAAQPSTRLTMVRFPEGKGAGFTVMFEAADENYRAAPNSMVVRGTPDGAAHVDKVVLWRDLPRAKRFLEWLPRLHQGEFGGVIVRLLWSLTGCMPAVLYVSGFLMWRRRIAAGQSSFAG